MYDHALRMLGVAVITVLLIVALTVLQWWHLLACVALFTSWMVLSRAGRQAWSVAQLGIATVPQRLGSTAVVVVGVAGVVGVLLTILAMGAGFELALQQTGSDDTAIILRSGQRTETGSTIDRETIALVSQASQVLRTEQNRPIVSPEQVITALLRRSDTGLDANVAIRGVGEYAWDLRPHVRIIQGRKLESGKGELLVGKHAHEKFAGLDIGSTLRFDGHAWTIVGIFDSMDVQNSEIWGDTEVLGSAYRRQGTANSLTLRLTHAHAFDALKTALESDPRLRVHVQTTRQFYNQQSTATSRIIRLTGTAVGLIMALGAVVGALNSTYMTIAARSREIATLRAIGFSGGAVIVSLLLETMLLAAVGGAIGAAITWAIFDGFTATTIGAAGQVTFAFYVSANLLWSGLRWALAIGLIGGLLPAIRAARLPVAVGLRES